MDRYETVQNRISCQRAHADLCAGSGEEVVAAGALVDVPGRQQAQRALPGLGLEKIAQVVQLILQVAVREHHTLQADLPNVGICLKKKHINRAKTEGLTGARQAS